ncbi:MAG: hypothetical protein ACRDGH_03030 [Candidatus Limnocylindria bacterium]
MSFEEKATWVYAVVAAGVSIVYFVIILGQAGDTPVAEIAYAPVMLAAIGVAIALSIMGAISVAISSPQDADKADERDRDIHRYGEYFGFYVLSVGVVVALILTIAEVEYFWIANMIYLAFVAASLTSAVLKIRAYRRGF